MKSSNRESLESHVKAFGVFSHKTLANRQRRGLVEPTYLFVGSRADCLVYIAKAAKVNRRTLDDLDLVVFTKGKTRRTEWWVKELPVI